MTTTQETPDSEQLAKIEAKVEWLICENEHIRAEIGGLKSQARSRLIGPGSASELPDPAAEGLHRWAIGVVLGINVALWLTTLILIIVTL